MTSINRALHGGRLGLARMFSRSSSGGDRENPGDALAVHHKLILLGSWLLVSCAAIAALGIWGLRVINHDQEQLTQREVPVLTQLLRTDIDLYEGQLGLERAAAASDPAQRKAGLAFFFENISQSDDKFNAYKALAMGAEQEGAAITAYEADRAKWVRATEELAAEIASIQGNTSGKVVAQNITSSIEAARALFQTMRGSLNRIVVGIYRPAIEASADRLNRMSTLTGWRLFICALASLLAGIILTRRMAGTLRLQQQAAEAINRERVEENHRQVFEGRLSRGLEMAQDEDGALRLVEQAISIAAPDVNTEILLADSSRAHLHQAATTGQIRPGGGCRVPKPSDCPAVRRGHRLDFESGGLFDSCPYLKGRPGGNCSAVCIPISIMGQTVGVLHATAADKHLPPKTQVQALEQVASKSGERIGLLRAFQRTQAQAMSDPLTGLMNRRSLEEKVHELTRQHVPFAVAYGDLDHFKNLNDTHGHETGDKALRTFGQVLKASIRPGDLVARWGGEEFVMVLPLASADEAVIVLDRVRLALANMLRGADTPAFTVSFGVARTAEGRLFVDVLASADESLLQAKKEGRNRTVRSPDLAPVHGPAKIEGDEHAAAHEENSPASAAA